MKRIMFGYLLMIFSTISAAQSQSNDIQSTIKNISRELASINQDITQAYQINQNISQSKEPSSNNDVEFTFQQESAYETKFVKNYNHKKTDSKINSSYDKSIYEKIILEMYNLKKEYENNPYIKITGFDINIGVMIPSVTITIEFKK